MGLGLDPLGERSGAEQAIHRRWTFDELVALALRLPAGAGADKLLRVNASGIVSAGYSAGNAVDTQDQTASLLGTLVASGSAPADYLVTADMEVTTAGGADRTLALSLTYTDDAGAATPTVIAAFSAAVSGRVGIATTVHLASGGIDYTGSVAGVLGAAPHWRGRLHATRLA